MFIKRYIPDFKDQSGGLNMQFLVRQYPGATQTVASSKYNLVRQRAIVNSMS